jgi:hypothetical protein
VPFLGSAEPDSAVGSEFALRSVPPRSRPCRRLAATSPLHFRPSAPTAIDPCVVDPVGTSTSATEGQPPPSQHDSIFCRQSWHHHAERIQKSRWAWPVIAQSIDRGWRGARRHADAAALYGWQRLLWPQPSTEASADLPHRGEANPVVDGDPSFCRASFDR